MDSFEANKIFGAILGVIFVLFGGSLLAEGIFHSEVPEKPGFAITALEAPAAGEAAADPNAVTPVAAIMASASPDAGAAQFKKCQACHSGEKGGPNKVGPDLWDLVERPIAHHEGFAYSAALKDFATKDDGKWTWDKLNHFLHGPKQYINGTAMGFAGIKNDKDRGDLLAYLRTLSDSPKPLPVAEPAAAPAGEAPAGQAAPAPAGDAPANATTSSENEMQPQGGAQGVGSTPATPSTPPGAASGNAASPQAPGATPAPGAAPAPPAPAN